MSQRATKIALIYTAAEDVKTLTARVKSCVTFAESKDWAIREEIVELGGNHLAPETIPEILKEAASRGFHILVIDSLSRLGLDEVGLLEFLEALEKSGRHMACIDEDIFTWSELGKFNLFATIALGRHLPKPPLPSLSIAAYYSSRSGTQESMRRQRKACKTRIEMKGWASAGDFTDLDEALSSEADALLIYSLDRLPSKKPIDLYKQLTRIQEAGKHLLTVCEGIDTRDTAGRHLFGLHALPFASTAPPITPSRPSIGMPQRRVGATPKPVDLPGLLKDWLLHKSDPSTLSILDIAQKHNISKVTVFSRLRPAIAQIQNALQTGSSLEELSKSREISVKSLQYALDWIELQESKKNARSQIL